MLVASSDLAGGLTLACWADSGAAGRRMCRTRSRPRQACRSTSGASLRSYAASVTLHGSIAVCRSRIAVRGELSIVINLSRTMCTAWTRHAARARTCLTCLGGGTCRHHRASCAGEECDVEIADEHGVHRGAAAHADVLHQPRGARLCPLYTRACRVQHSAMKNPYCNFMQLLMEYGAAACAVGSILNTNGGEVSEATFCGGTGEMHRAANLKTRS